MSFITNAHSHVIIYLSNSSRSICLFVISILFYIVPYIMIDIKKVLMSRCRLWQMTPLDAYFRSIKLFLNVEIHHADKCNHFKHAIKISSCYELSELFFFILFVVIRLKWHFCDFLCLGHIMGHLPHTSSFYHKYKKDYASIYHICGFWTKIKIKNKIHCERHLPTLAHIP